MKSLAFSLLSIGLFGVTGCANSLKLENVAGTWSCDRVDGVCANIAQIDAGTIGSRIDGQAVGSPEHQILEGEGGIVPISGEARSIMPSRTADEVARIVLAPSLDAQGRYHSSRVLFAVMKPGDWVPGSAPLDEPALSRQARSDADVDVDLAETAAVNAVGDAASLASEAAARKVTRTYRRTILPAPSLSPREDLDTDDQVTAQIADETNAQ